MADPQLVSIQHGCAMGVEDCKEAISESSLSLYMLKFLLFKMWYLAQWHLPHLGTEEESKLESAFYGLRMQLIGRASTVRGQDLVLWNNPSVHCVNMCCYDWFDKQADGPVVEQDKVRQESQTENDGMKKGRVRGVDSLPVNKLDRGTKWDRSKGHELRGSTWINRNGLSCKS